VSRSEESVGGPLEAPELAAVAEAAGARLRGDADEDREAKRAAAERLLAAATSAMGAGYSLSEIAGAEARGKDDVRRELRGEALRRVERSGRHARDAEADHHRAIARAVRLGLSTREIAAAAGVTHGTVRTISNRYAASRSAGDLAADQPLESEDQGSGTA
jgi:predicted transcriptional regulator